MTTVTVSTNPVQQSFPAGTVQGKWRIDIGGDPVLSDEPSAVFQDVPVGSYTATIQALNADGNPLGDPRSMAFVINEPVVLSVAGDVSVVIQ